MTKRVTDSVLYFYYVTLNKMARLIRESIPRSDIAAGLSEIDSVEILKDKARELGIKVEDLADGACELKNGDVIRRVRTGPLLDLDNAFALWLTGNKYATFELLKKYGFQNIPHFRRFSIGTIREAEQDFMSRNRPVVVKPSCGTSGGLGVTVNIHDVKHLKRAIFNSLRYDTSYLIEDFVEGDNFRFLFFRDKMIDVIHRIPANVKGDGINNIRHLIEMENERRASAEDEVPLDPIRIDNDLKQTLLNRKMSLGYVPTKGETVQVVGVCNFHAGGETMGVKSIIHPDIVRDCKDIMKIMDITLGGIDIITRDISKPLSETGGVVNEVNMEPGLHFHNKTVAKDILDQIFEKEIR
jgi:cyanophycin synthetase